MTGSNPTNTTSGTNSSTTLTATRPEEVRKELNLEVSTKGNVALSPSTVLPGLEDKASQYVQEIMNFSMEDDVAKESRKKALELFGLDTQKRAASQSSMLKKPIATMSQRSADGSDVSNALINLKVTVEGLDPAKFNFEPGWLSRMVGFIPGVGTPLKKYFSKFESAQTVLDAIISSLEKGRDQLTRDNVTMVEDQKRMREQTKDLTSNIQLAQMMDQKLEYELERNIQPTDPKNAFIKEELLFPLRQRALDLQQQLAVNQQGVLALEVVMRNNKELIRGVNRALNVTVNALGTAGTVAMGLAEQKLVLDKVNALNTTTDSLIRGTAERLKTQGVEIHKQAASTQINMDTLKAAFADINSAMDDLSKFRSEALPGMAKSILEMNAITEKAEQSVKKMEEGKAMHSQLKFDV